MIRSRTVIACNVQLKGFSTYAESRWFSFCPGSIGQGSIGRYEKLTLFYSDALKLPRLTVVCSETH